MIKDYFTAFYIGDNATAKGLSAYPDKYDPFPSVPADPEQIEKTKKAIEEIEIELTHSLKAEKDIFYNCYFLRINGHPTFACTIKSNSKVYFDNRWDQGTDQEKKSPEATARVFLFSLLNKDKKELKKVTPSGTDLDILLKEKIEIPDIAHIYLSALEMPVIRVETESFGTEWTSEFKEKPFGKSQTTVLGMYLYKFIPFHLKKERGKWVVLPYNYLECIKKYEF